MRCSGWWTPCAARSWWSRSPICRSRTGTRAGTAACTARSLAVASMSTGCVLARDPGWPLVFAVEASTWCRDDADCSAERGYYYHSSRHSNGQPIVAGWSYQWIAQLNWPADSWTAPLDAVRLDPRPEAVSTEEQAAGQIRAMVARLGPTADVPWCVFDGGYDPVQLTVALAGVRVQHL